MYPRAFMTLRVVQFSLKMAHLSFSMGPRGSRAYDLRPRLWLWCRPIECQPRCRPSMSVEVSTECRLTYRPSIDRYWRLTVYHLEENFDRGSTKCRSISRPSVGRDVGRVSAECQPRCRWSMWVEYVAPYLGRYSTNPQPIVSVDT